MKTLTLADAGIYTVVTASGSAYVIDTDARTALRTPSAAVAVEALADPSEKLRKDGSAVALKSINTCTVGAPLILFIEGVAEVGPTLRRATTVISIERAA
jgi:hypothetical protein